MAVTNTDTRSPATGGYDCNGSVTDFAGTFRILAEGDVQVILADSNGTESTLTLTTDYTISPTGGSYPADAFTVTTVTTYASGNTITLVRNMDLTQPTSYGNQGPYVPANHETSYDRNLLLIQQQQEVIDRCVKDSASGTAVTDPDSYLAACQAAQAAAEAASSAINDNVSRTVRVRATGNVAIATGLENGDTIDGVTLATGDRVLLDQQSTASEDGIYSVVASGAGTRVSDWAVGDDVGGSIVSVTEGTANGDTVVFVKETSSTVGTDGISVEELMGNDGVSITIPTVYGGAAASDDLTLESTSNATKGDIILQPDGGNVLIAGTSQVGSGKLYVNGASYMTSLINASLYYSRVSAGADGFCITSSGGTKYAYITSTAEGAQNVGLAFHTTTNAGVSTPEAMRVTSDQQVLIGTTTAGASKLVVNDDSIQINTSKTPASASATGTTGQVAWDSSYVYVCVATDTWKRAAISTW